MVTISNYLNYVELAQASYGLNYITGMYGTYEYIDSVGEKHNVLTDTNNKVNFFQTQAKNFAKTYKVLATSEEYNIGNISDFNAVLFGEVDENNNLTGKKVLALRGSQEILDYVVDVVELALSGNIVSQTTSMENFYQKLLENNVLSSQETIDVTGHSLGGFLAQSFTIKHPEIVDKAYTYNAPGFGGILTELFSENEILQIPNISSKITNIYANEGTEGTAGFGVLIGNVVPISIDGGSGINLYNHKIGFLTESLHVQNTLVSLMNLNNYEELLPLLEYSTNSSIINTLDILLNNNNNNSLSIIDKAIYLSEHFQNSINSITPLYNYTQTTFNNECVTPAFIYALEHNNPFIINGDFPIYQEIQTKLDNGYYSSLYLEKLKEMTYYSMHKNEYELHVFNTYKNLETNTILSDGNYINNNIIFGKQNLDNEIIDTRNYATYNIDSEIKTNDSVFGMDGNDTIYTGLGNDTIQGGLGDDSIDAGKDNDVIEGGLGSDTMYGGKGLAVHHTYKNNFNKNY